ncbi:alpha/beta hydrolase [Nocardia sp. XZ_19_385]|uniref:alpha/beta hydrolase n=1 Tax=Nocardia sp. XZ_19_385 TaxID=2769488 RepID=UPI00188E3FD3|nr:alpha/beta hydrolase [Nocardia sp. XZ_19_385]
MPLAGELAPGAAKLGIRGAVATNEGYAFFRRFPDRRVDEEDIAARVPVLAEFIERCWGAYELTRRPVAIGFSNGAIMAAALLLTHPRLLAGAILFRPLSPFGQDPPTQLDGTPVLIIDGANDSRRSPGDGLQLADRLRHAGALVTHQVLPVGHSITAEDSATAHTWLQALQL